MIIISTSFFRTGSLLVLAASSLPVAVIEDPEPQANPRRGAHPSTSPIANCALHCSEISHSMSALGHKRTSTPC